MKSYSLKFKIFFLAIIFCGLFGLAGSSRAATINGIKYTTIYVDNTTKNSLGVETCANGDVAYNPATDTCVEGAYLFYNTIQGAANMAEAGDTILVASGTYTDIGTPPYYLVYIKPAGTAQKWITLKAEEKWGAVLDAQNITSACLGFDDSAGYINIEDFEIKNCTGNGITANDTNGTYNIRAYRNKIHHAMHTGIAFKGGAWKIDSNTIYDIYGAGLHPDNYHGIYISSSNNTVINNIVYDIADGWPIHVYNSSFVPESDNYIGNNTLDASRDATVVGGIILAAKSPNLIVENNIIYGANTAAIRATANNSGAGVIIRNNLTDSGAMCTGSYCDSLSFPYNSTGTNPLFLNILEDDYHIQSGSSAINAGYDNAVVRNLDYDNDKVSGVPDIGADEYHGPGNIVPPAAPSGLNVQ